MEYLNKLWLTLIIIGVVMLVASIVINVAEVVSGTNTTFDENINEFPSNVLIDPALEEHLQD